MDKNGNKIIWTVVIISAIAIIGLMFVKFMPSQASNIKTAIGNKLSLFENDHTSDSSGNDTKSDNSSTNSSSSSSSSSTAVDPNNLLINTSSSATNGQTEVQGANPQIYGKYSRTDSYEQVTAPSSGEFFYRFMTPDESKLYSLKPNTTYTLSGSASHTSGELKVRVGFTFTWDWWDWDDYSRGGISDLGIPVSDGSVFTPFSYTFYVRRDATGAYISLQNYDYTTGSFFRFKDLKLVQD